MREVNPKGCFFPEGYLRPAQSGPTLPAQRRAQLSECGGSRLSCRVRIGASGLRGSMVLYGELCSRGHIRFWRVRNQGRKRVQLFLRGNSLCLPDRPDFQNRSQFNESASAFPGCGSFTHRVSVSYRHASCVTARHGKGPWQTSRGTFCARMSLTGSRTSRRHLPRHGDMKKETCQVNIESEGPEAGDSPLPPRHFSEKHSYLFPKGT